MILLLTLACSLRLGSNDPSPTDDPTDTPVDTDTTADTDSTTLTAHIEPAAPNWDDDLRCIPSVELPDDYTIKWTVNGNDFEDALGTFYRGDTIPHLKQAGGQTWSCTVTVGTESATSDTAFIQPIVPMVMLPPGSFKLAARQHSAGDQKVYELSRPYWIAVYELTWAQWDQHLPRPATRVDIPAEHAMAANDESHILFYTNILSILDGTEPCFPCDGPFSDDVRCDDSPPNLYDCSGYRVPTMLEWDYAASAGGQHEDPLPAGGIWAYDPAEDTGLSSDPPVVGRNAPIGTFLSDQCWIGGTTWPFRYNPPGLTIPNALGIYDMCGNAAELVAGAITTLGGAPRDAYGTTAGGMGGALTRAMPTGRWYRSAGAGGLRLTRTNTPLPPPASSP